MELVASCSMTYVYPTIDDLKTYIDELYRKLVIDNQERLVIKELL